MTITFANTTTTAQVNTVLQGITYSNSNNNPPASVVLAFTINDANTPSNLTKTNPQGTGVAATASGSITVAITANNDAPTLTGLITANYTEKAVAITLSSAAVPGDPELSNLASQAGDLGGLTLTLSRSVTANALDQFGWTGSGDSGVNASGSSVRIDTTSVGSFTHSGGTLAITFASSVTKAQVQQVLRGITYQFSGEFLAAAVTANITLNWVLNDGNVTAQGQGEAKRVTVAQTVTIKGINTAPVLADTALPAVASSEDAAVPFGVVGSLVSSLATSSNITDLDTNAVLGIAITATDTTRGDWYFFTSATNRWVQFTATASTARLFTAAGGSRLYFKPTANWNGTVASAFTFRAWDARTGLNGGTVDLSSGDSTGGTNSYSTATDTVSLTVTPVNDAPTKTADTATLAAINEDQATSSTDVNVVNDGATVSSLFSGVFSDATDTVIDGSSANGFAGVVVVNNSASASTQGAWQSKIGANGTWANIGGAAIYSGRYLDDGDFIRFVPVAHFNGTPSGLVVRLADNSTDAVVSGTLVNVQNDTLSGSSTRYSSSNNVVTLNTSVTAINDAPLVDLNGSTVGTTNAVLWTEGQNVSHTAVTLAPSCILTDVDNTNFTTLTLVVGGILDGDQERISIGGVAFPLGTDANLTEAGSFLVSYVYTANTSSGIFTVVPGGSSTATNAAFQTLMRGLTYIHASDNPTDGNRTVAMSVTDAGLTDATPLTSQRSSTEAAVTINVNPSNDQPKISGLTPVSFSENAINATAAVLDSDVTMTEDDSADYTGGYLTVSGLNGSDTVSLPSSASAMLGNVQKLGIYVQYYTGIAWITVGTCTGGVGANFGVTWSVNSTPAIVERVIENLTFANSSHIPVTSRTLTLALNDGDGGVSQSATITVAIISENDAPTLAIVTAGTISEVNQSSTTVNVGLSGLLSGSDVDAETLTYGIVGETAVSGTVSKAGTYGTLAVTAATGAYAFTKNTGAIEALDATETGTDTFTVSVSDGDGSLVTQSYTVTVTGADDAPALDAVTEGSIAEVDQ